MKLEKKTDSKEVVNRLSQLPLIALVSSDPKKYTTLKEVVLYIDPFVDISKTIQKLEGESFLNVSNQLSVKNILNQVNSKTDVLILDVHSSYKLGYPKLLIILSYIEDVFRDIDVIIFADPNYFSKEILRKIIQWKAPKNNYHFFNNEQGLLHFLFIITNCMRNKNKLLQNAQELATLQDERKKLYKYLSEDVVQAILFSDEKAQKSTSKKSTVMFLDIRNFTGISEKLEPEQVVELLDLLFTDIVDLIFSNKGSVNKFIGDAILATFGCPRSYGNDAENAVKCAINLIAALSIFNQVKPAFLDDEISLGIGIATGNVFAGNVGSHRKMEYTVIGDTVNLASRLQDMTKKLSCNLVIDGQTCKEMDGQIPFKQTNIHNVRGKKQKLDIYYLPNEYYDSI